MRIGYCVAWALLGAASVSPGQTPPPDPVMQALLDGEAAQASGDYSALRDAAQGLQALGATPAPGQEDLASRWSRESSDHGVARPNLASRGRALGPAYRRGALAPGATMRVEQIFLGGQRAQISVAPTRREPGLSVEVRATDGTTRCARSVGGGQADCVWMPLFTDRYVILIQNKGDTNAAFYLLMR